MATEAAVGAAAAATAALGDQRWDLTLLEVHRVSGTSITDSFEQYAASCTARGSESMAAEPKPHAKDVCQILQTLKDCHDLGLDDMFDMFDSQEPRPFAQQRRAVVTIVKDRFSALRTACVAQLAAGRLTNAEATLAQIEEIKELREVFADDAIKPDSEFDELGGSLAHKSGAFDQGVLDALNHLEFAELAKLLHGFRGRKSNADQEQYALGIGRVHKAGDEKFKRAKDIIASISEGATSPLPRSIDDLASVLRWIDDVKQLQEGGEPLLGPAFVDKWTSAFGDFGRKLKLLGDRKSKLGEWHFQQVENILRKFEELASLSFPEAVRATIEEIRRELDTALEQKKGSLCEDLEKVLAEGDHLTVDLIFERVKEAQGDFLTHDHTIRINQKLQAHILKLVEGTNTHFVNFDIKEAHGQWGLLKKLKQSTSVLRLLQGNDAEQALEEVAKQIKGKMLTPQWLWRPDAFAKLEGFYKVKPVEFATHVGRFMTEEIGGQVTVLMGRMGTKASVSTFEELVQKEFPVFARNLPSECSTFEKLWKELWTKLVETTKEKFQKTCVAMKGTMPSHETGDSIPFLLAARKLLRAELLRAELLPSCCGPELLQAGVALQEQHGDEFRHPLKAPGRAAASSEGGGDFISGGLGGGWKSTCSICNVTCNGTVQFEEHLRGAKHKEAEAAAAISSGASPSAFAGVRRAPAKGPPRDSVHSLLPQMFAFPMPLELKDGEVTELLEKLDELLRAVNVNVGVIDKAWSTHVENFDLKEAGLDFGATLRFLRELKLKEGAIEVAPAYGLHRSPPTVAKACQKILRTATQQVQSLSADLPQDGVTVYNNLVKVVIPALYTVEDEQPDLFVGMLEQMNAAENWVSRAEVQFATESQCLYKKAMGERDSSKSKALLSQVTAIMEKHRDLLEKLVEVGLRKEIEQDTPLVTAIKNSNSFRLDSVFAMISKGSCEARDVSEAIHEVYVTAGNLVADESIQQHAKTGICAVLQCAVQHEKRNGFGLQKLGEFLETDFPQGGEIVHNMPHFAEFSLIEFQKMTSGKKPADVVAELKEMNNLSDAGAKHLFVITETIFKNYEDIMRKTAYHCDYPAIVARIRGGKSDIPALVGGVLAIWSRSSTTAECQTPRRPLPAQVLAIARLLALDAKPKQSMANHALAAAGSFTGLSWLQNGNAIDSSHLAQLKTGQGKSVVLGVLATVLAVSGFHVDCVCYSAYLCERDALDFATIFRFFDVQEMVMYGTFQQLSERLVNECGDVRELTRSMFSSASVERGSGGGGAVRAKAASAGKKRILLVDEVDVFFSKDFYGETYNPVVPLVYGEIAAMQRMMWKMREQPFNTILQAVKGMDEHGALMLEYAGVSKLIDGQIQKMLRDLEAWKSSSEVELYRCYKMIDGKVAYKSGVCYSDKISYGYMTLWTYLNEQEQRPQSVDEGAVKAQFGLSIMCGRFSYAAIPKWYSLILGVTGTLVPEAPGKQHPLGSFEQAIIHDDFKIKGQTALPSVFGEKRLTFREAEHVCVHPDEAAYYAEIGLQIEKAREGRAVLIFFESEAKLQAYQDSEYGRQHSAGTVDTITLATRNITQRVLRATHSGSATLLSREHGRGLDFHCRDKRVEATGGIHVVQTFLSEELSEEIQIRGRTARQKNKGSFELVLLASDLEKFSITAAELAAKDKGVYVAAAIASEASPADPAAVAGGGAAAASSPPQTLYEFLHLRRDALLEKSVEARKEAVKAAQKQHDLTLAFQRDLVALHACGAGLALRKDGLEWKRCMEFLGERNIHTAKCRLVIATDATGSMSRTWARTQGSICAMLERIEEISDGRGSIDVKFVAYRDYELDRSQVLEASVWTSDPASLVRFVGGIRCHSGVGCDGPEAVEAALNLVNKEADPPTQVLLIADASPHMERKGQAPGCTVHASNRARGELVEGGVLQTDYRIECAALAKKGVKVNGMYIGGHCKAAIDDIAKITGGESRPFDVADAEALIHAVCEAGLKDIGGEEMVAKYRAQYRS